MVGGNSPWEFRPFFPRIKIPSTVVDRCSDRHFSLCPVVGGNSPREFRQFFPRIKIPSWMHSELHFPAVNHPGVVIYRKCRTFLCVQWSAETRLENSIHSFRALNSPSYGRRPVLGPSLFSVSSGRWKLASKIPSIHFAHGCILNCTLWQLIRCSNIQRPVLPQKMQNRQHNCHITDRQRN